MGLSNCFSSWSSPRKSLSSSINKGDLLALVKDIIPCNIPMGLTSNHYIIKYI
jgi:hypothetical protein